MIFHINRMTFKSDLSEEQRRAGLDLLRQAGEANPAVQSYVVGPDLGGEFEWGAVYVLEDLDGYWEYLTHPAHVRSEMNGMELIDRFEASTSRTPMIPSSATRSRSCKPETTRNTPSSPSWRPRCRRSLCPTPKANSNSISTFPQKLTYSDGLNQVVTNL